MRKLLPILLLLTTTTIFAQKATNSSQIKVSGTVLEEGTNLPLEYATLVLQRVDNLNKVTGGITDQYGKYAVEAQPGKYNIRIEYIGYKSYLVANQNLTKSINLGTIKLSPDVSQLDEIELVGEKTTVEVRLDKKIYNIGKDLTNSGANISDALNNVPSVTVDVEGAISLRGNENVRILINGKPSAMSGFGSTDALSQLPADAIEKVEVITSPSARYDAEGTAGILNIVLKKEKTLGFNGSVNTTIGYPNSSQVSTNLNVRTNKFNVFTTFGYTFRQPPGNAFYDNTYTSSDFDRVTEDRDIEREDKAFNANLGMEYFITEKSSITGSVFGRLSDESDITETDSDMFNDGVLEKETFRIQDEKEDDKSLQVSLNYVNNFDDDGHKLTGDFQYSYDYEDILTRISENNTFPTTEIIAQENIYEDETQNEYLFQVDYVLPMGDAQFEAGYRGNFEQSISDYQLDTININTGEFQTNLELTNKFTYDENINALYTQYGNKFGDFSFLLGARLENTQLKGKVESEYDEDALAETFGDDIDLNFDKNYLGLFPTVNFIYELDDMESVSVGYNRRINRPRGRYINPFPSRTSTTNVFQGNPDLDPAYANAFDVGYLKRWKKITFTSSVYYQKETNSFERIQEETGEQTNDGIDIIRTIPINLSSNERIGAEAGLLYSPAKWLRLNGSVNIYQFKTEGVFNDVDYGTENVSWFSRLSSKVTLPAKVEWQTNAFYRGPSETSQTKSEGMFFLTLAFSKDVFKDNGTLSFNVRDVFNSAVRRSFTQSDTFTSDSELQYRERQITLGFMYRFNQPKGKSKERQQGGGDDDEGDF
ncbi:TonB-dependent receptor family protein [Cellulophaga baltica]|uniref:outer membrane beta-barrel family protein n=1 Tax=Cellulophaga TaxID=104264 RepID=UPI001C06CF04|nr:MULTISPECIES: outer membrane beta-barrel family protein [Cellulophaga]MBU2996118.1 TonB-dependent receptor family protein [Cellulophaga baltica]MDO6767513.1 outer membrane beta-barrel family protein [Cellulophaga sp. 1_MG-2023]